MRGEGGFTGNGTEARPTVAVLKTEPGHPDAIRTREGVESWISKTAQK